MNRLASWLCILLACLSINKNLRAQSNPKSDPLIYAAHITEEDLKAYLTVLTSDSLEGRETGTVGNEKAANFIAGKFKDFGLEPIGDNKSYYQGIYLNSFKWDHYDILVNKAEFRSNFDFLAFPTLNEDVTINTNEVLFLNYGIDDPKYSDYNNVNVKDKVIMIYEGEPRNADSISLLTGNREGTDWSIDNTKKLKLAYSKGVRYVLIIKEDIPELFSNNRTNILGNKLTPAKGIEKLTTVNHAYIGPNVMKEIMGDKFKKFLSKLKKSRKSGKPFSMEAKVKLLIKQKRNIKEIRSRNILGFLKGSDPKLSDEVLIITAHMDHLGKRDQFIYHGADDDGSGTSTVIELANTFSLAKKMGFGPRRSMLFMTVTGEEKGLLGSDYYTTFPIIDLKNTVADLNIDMVGRIDEKYKDNPHYIYLIGSDKLSTELHKLSETTNDKYAHLILDYTYNDEKDPNRYYYRSDHYNFAKNNIPVIFYFNGTHADYHKPTDTIEKIRFDIMVERARLVFLTAWEICNRDERVKVDIK